MTSPMSSLFNNMRRREQDSHSMTSAASKASDRRKAPRFSLRRLFYRRPSLTAATRSSSRSVRSASELETRSVSSLPSCAVERDAATSGVLHSTSSSDEAERISRRSYHQQECPLCLTQHADTEFPPISTCHHRSCRDCLRQYLRIEITESRVNIACPECAEKFHPNDIKRILEDPNLMAKYESFMLRRIMVADPDARWCPAPDCGYAVIASGCASCPKLKCERPGCNTYFCYHCKQYWHPNQTCDAARAERSSNMRSSSLSYSHESSPQSKQNGDIKPCPRCGAFIIKMDDGSCNHMTCAVCGAEFCWLCMKEISDLHYLSPSGCTFWGKKPWSRKKKILWQLGTLVGAPVGIGLVAGIAVPAMIIGIPVWVGRKLHAQYEHAPKHRRNLVITGGVTASILVSPLLAGLAVGIGVPILLAYVYGVVPISLCRSGGCGVTTTNSGGVRFEFDDDNDVTVGVSGPYTGSDAQSVETTSHNVANPSIGPSIGEMSVAMTNSLSASGSHMERVGALRDESDRDSASNRALAGASLNGSLSGSAVAGPSGFQNRLEVQADVSTSHGAAKRNSLSSESANFSIDAKSATVSFSDDASTKALAGSICQKDKDNQSAVVPPFEVHVDVVNSSARYRHGSGNSNAEHGATAKLPSGQESPTSGRSVTFIADDVGSSHYPRTKLNDDLVVSHYSRTKHIDDGGNCHYSRSKLGDDIGSSHYGRTKRYKRQSMSVDERIHEHAERSHQGALSISSLEGHQVAPVLAQDTGIPTTSVSFDSVSSPPRLPEVDSDRPVVFLRDGGGGSVESSASSTESSAETISLVHGRAAPRKTTASTPRWHANPESLGSEDELQDAPCSHPPPTRLGRRRTSCELAMKEGRLSPKLP